MTQTIADFKAEVEKMRAAGVTRGLSGDAVSRVFGIVFVLEQLRGNLEDLASRTDESALER